MPSGIPYVLNMPGGIGYRDFAFLNFMKSWKTVQSSGGYAFPSVLNVDGYPTSAPTTKIYGRIELPSDYTGHWIIDWSGSIGASGGLTVVPQVGGGITVHSGAAFVSGGTSSLMTLKGTDGSVEFSFAIAQPYINVEIPATIGSYTDFANLRLYRADRSSNISNGEIFEPSFLQVLRDLNPGVLRFIGWIPTSNNNYTRYAYLRSESYISWASDLWVPDLWVGDFSGTDTYTCSAPTGWSGLVDGATVQGRIVNANTDSVAISGAANNGSGLIRLTVASTAGWSTGDRKVVSNFTGGTIEANGFWTITVIDGTHIDLQGSSFTNAYTSGSQAVCSSTLNVGATGAKLISSINPSFAPRVGESNALSANTLHTFIYDSSLDAWLLSKTVPNGLVNTVPLSVIISLCNQLNKYCWLNIPTHFDSSSVASFVQYARDNLSYNLKCYIEYSNEIWNSGFSETDWAYQRGRVDVGSLGTIRQRYGMYALRHRQFMETAMSAWAPRDSTQLVRVMGCHAHGGTTGNTEDYRFKGTDLSAYGYNSAPNRPIDYTDMVAIAPYVCGKYLQGFSANYTHSGGDPLTPLLDAADDYASGDPSRMASAIAWVDDDLRSGTRASVLGIQTLQYAVDTLYPDWNTIAASYNKRVICYEGGYEADAPTVSRLNGFGLDGTTYGGNTGLIEDLIRAYKSSDTFRVSMIEYFSDFMSFSQSSMPSWFALLYASGDPAEWQWGIFKQGIDETYYKSFDALAAANRRSVVRMRLR